MKRTALLIKDVILPTASLVLLCLLMLFSERVKLSLSSSLEYISSVVLGVIFPTSVVIRLFCFSEPAEWLTRAISKTAVWKRTGLSPHYLPSVLAGQISGFPMTAILLPTGENRDLALALGSVVSPAFLSAVMGMRDGLWLWGVHIATLYIFAMLTPAKKESFNNPTSVGASFSKVLSDSVSSAVAICGAMLFFSSVLSIVPSELKELFSAILEIGNATRICTSPLYLSFALSFGGLSVCSQISFCAGEVSLRLYLLSRLVLFFPTVVFIVYPKMRFFITLLILLVLMSQIVRKTIAKNEKISYNIG